MVEGVLARNSLASARQNYKNFGFFSITLEQGKLIKGYSPIFSFLDYLPLVSFIPLTRNDRVRLTPVLSLNTNSVFNYLQQKLQQKTKLQSLDRKAQLNFNEDLTKLRLLYARIQHETAALSQTNILAEIEKKQFAIYQEAFAKRELSPLDFLEKEKHYQVFLLSLNQKHEAIYLLILEIRQLARYQMPDVELALPEDCE